MGFVKVRKFTKTCVYCGEDFKAADIKASICEGCKKPRPCLCGCGELATSAKHPYRLGHAGRVGTVSILQGRKKQARAISGENNPAKRNGKKLSEALKSYWASLTPTEKRKRCRNSPFVKSKPPAGHYPHLSHGFRSDLELQVSRLIKARIGRFDYEPRMRYKNGKRFYPDFVIKPHEQEILIEVSGFAYQEWQDQFVKKIKAIQKLGHVVICVTYPDKVDSLKARVTAPVYSLKDFGKCLDILAQGSLPSMRRIVC